MAEKTERQLKMEQKQLDRLNKAREEKERVSKLTQRGVPKPKTATTLATLPTDEASGGSLLGVGPMAGGDPADGQEAADQQLEQYYKPPAAAPYSGGIGKGTASIADVGARRHQRLGITPAPAHPGVSRHQAPIVGYF